MMFKKISMLAAAAMLSLGTAASAATVFSDNFDNDLIGVPTASLINWNVTVPSVDVIGSLGTGGPSFDFYPGNGNYLDMNGSTAPGSEGRIETNALGLVLGKQYTLTFDYGANSFPGLLPALLTFGLGTDLITLAINAIPATLQQSLSYIFTYDGSGDYLSFADTSGTDNDQGGPVLDNVVLSAVPLPAGGLLLLGALGGFAALRRRKTT